MAKTYPRRSTPACRRRLPPLLFLIPALVRPDGASSLRNPVRLVALPTTSAFFPPAPRRRDVSLGAEADVAEAAAAEPGKGVAMTTLRFRGSTSYTTEEVPRDTDGGRSIADFFAREECRNLLMTGTGNVVRPLGPDGTTPELRERWAAEADRVGAAAPEEGDEAVRVTTQGIQFPGLKVVSVTTIGPRLLLPAAPGDDGGGGWDSAGASPDPEYEFTLIADEIKAEGPRPLKWIFRRLTEFGRKRDGKMADREQTTHSLTRVRVKPAEGESNGVVFTASAYLEVEVKFPTFLLKILPMSKEKTEEQGTASIQKVVEKELGPSMERFRDAYMEWLES